MRSPRVLVHRRQAAEKPGGSATFAEQEKRNDLAKGIAAAAAAAGPLSRLYSGTSSREALTCMCTWRKYSGVLREVVYPNCLARVLQP
jgi:hypothetical protein